MAYAFTHVVLLGLLSLAAYAAAFPCTTRIMPLGASIVEQTCWRAYLWQKLQDAGVTNINFVGSHSGPTTCTWHGQTVAFDRDHEGHSGAKVTDYAKHGNVTTWLQEGSPNIVLIHIGTNDAGAGTSTQDFIQAYDTLLCQIRKQNPTMRIVLSKLIGIDHIRYGQGVADRIRSYNTAMSQWAKEKSKAQSPITLVDVYSGFNYQSMTKDGKHPNEAGDQFMAERYLTAVQHALAA